MYKGRIVIWSGSRLNCEHKRRRERCIECDGASICEHKRQRSACTECDGSSICEHKRRRNTCAECDGASICEHKRRRERCIECDGASICEHKRRRSACAECDGASICEHKRRRNTCTECDGSSICEHKRRRNTCKECDGSSICEHKRRRSACAECCPPELQYTRFCHVCGERDAKGRKYGTPGVCARCDKTIPERVEHKVKDYLLSKLPPPSGNDDKITGSECGESRRRADLVWIGHDRVIQVEIDEDEHKGRSVDCELGKMDSSKWGLHTEDQCKPMVFIRFNPDGCQSEEEFEQRCAQLVHTVEECLTMQLTPTLKTRVRYLYYSGTNKHLLAAKDHGQFVVDFNLISIK